MFHLQQRLISPTRIPISKEKLIKYESIRRTIGHQVLVQDRRAETVPDAVFRRLDAVLDQVESEVTVGSVTNVEEARAVFESIEHVVTSKNFICSIPYYLVHSFGEGLLPRALDRHLVYAPENDGVRSCITTLLQCKT